MKLVVHVVGRPAPEGSHDTGAQGQVLHSSAYLPAWRRAVRNAVFAAYRECGIAPEALPLIEYPRAVYLRVIHFIKDEQCRAMGTDMPTGRPDVDKLLRATIDGLGEGRAFGDDSQVLHVETSKVRSAVGRPGASIIISDAPMGAQEQGSAVVKEQYRITLDRGIEDENGDRAWETVILAQDDGETVADVWLPAIGRKLGVPLVADLSDLPIMSEVMPPQPEVVERTFATETLAEKPKRTRRTKAQIEADRAAEAAPAGSVSHMASATGADPSPENQEALGSMMPVPVDAPAQPAAPFNPFAQS